MIRYDMERGRMLVARDRPTYRMSRRHSPLRRRASRSTVSDMRDDLEFLVEFIREIERNAILYNVQHEGYGNKMLVNKVWKKIAEKFKLSVVGCKTKWRNIRSAYIRNLHGKGTNRTGVKKPYYLAQNLAFLNPFTKPRHLESTEQGAVPPDDYADDETSSLDDSNPLPYNEEFETVSIQSPMMMNASTPNCSIDYDQRNKPPLDDFEKCAVDSSYPNAKRRKADNNDSIAEKDSVDLFLMSIALKMRTMTEQQQLQFQMGAFKLIEQIKYSDNVAAMSHSATLASNSTIYLGGNTHDPVIQ